MHCSFPSLLLPLNQERGWRATWDGGLWNPKNKGMFMGYYISLYASKLANWTHLHCFNVSIGIVSMVPQTAVTFIASGSPKKAGKSSFLCLRGYFCSPMKPLCRNNMTLAHSRHWTCIRLNYNKIIYDVTEVASQIRASLVSCVYTQARIAHPQYYQHLRPDNALL